MHPSSHSMLHALWSSVGGDSASTDRISFVGDGALPSAFPVTDFAAASMGTAALAISELLHHAGVGMPGVQIDRRLASLWFGMSIRPVGWQLPEAWDSMAGDYRTLDGWLRLHTNAPHHRAAAERVLGAHVAKAGMAGAVARWTKFDLEAAVVAAGGCAAAMQSQDDWAAHPQGKAVAAEALVQRVDNATVRRKGWFPMPGRPLAGLRVLDLTRVLAGPVGSRFLAGYGAEVLRIDPLDWEEPALEPEVTPGKRCARLDLKSPTGRAAFEALLSDTDVLLHGYRADALERLGMGLEWRRRAAPGLVEVCHNAYGWSGPWALRRGFDSLVQMSCGVAHAGMVAAGADRPTPLPVQALDHATGYLVAAAAVRGLTQRFRTSRGSEARLSLAAVAGFLVDQAPAIEEPGLAPSSEADLSELVEMTEWGAARRVRWPVAISGTPARWDRPASSLGSSPPRWL